MYQKSEVRFFVEVHIANHLWVKYRNENGTSGTNIGVRDIDFLMDVKEALTDAMIQVDRDIRILSPKHTPIQPVLAPAECSTHQ
jgi:hypothetical protein